MKKKGQRRRKMKKSPRDRDKIRVLTRQRDDARAECLQYERAEYGNLVQRHEASIQVSKYRRALIGLLDLYDRAAGNVRRDHGWTAADVKLLEQIRGIASKSHVPSEPGRESHSA